MTDTITTYTPRELDAMTLQAWASTEAINPELIPGIGVNVLDVDGELFPDGSRRQHLQQTQVWVAYSGDLPDDWAVAGEDGDQLDVEAADAELAALGFRRAFLQHWEQDDTGQWSCIVTRA
jgi:hypothetical protein